MNYKNLIPIVLGVGVVYYIWNRSKKEKMKSMTASEVVDVATEKQKEKYTPAFLKQYDIVMPPNQASQEVKDFAATIQYERKAMEEIKMAAKKPIYI